MQGILILSLALALTLLATMIPGLGEWRRALTKNWQRAFLPMTALAGTMLGSTQAAALDSSLPDPLRLVRAVLYVFLFATACFTMLSNRNSIRYAGPGAMGMLLFSLFAIASSLWSIGPFISVWKGFEVLTLTLSIMAVSFRLRDAQDAVWLSHLFSLGLLYLCMTVFAGLILFPSLAIKDPDTTYTQYYFAVRGLVPVMNPATVGSISALLFVASVAPLLNTSDTIKAKRTGIYFSAILAASTMILGHSRTPIFACTIAIILILVYARRWKLILAAGGTGSVLLIATSIEAIVQQYILRGQTTDAFTSLTGRMGFWEGVWSQIEQSMIIGHGYYAAQRLTFDTNSVDNTYLEVIIGLGFTGLAVFLVPVLWAAYRIYSTRPKSSRINLHQTIWLIVAGWYTILIIRSFTGASFQVMHPLLVIYLITLVLTAYLYRSRQNARNFAPDTERRPDDDTIHSTISKSPDITGKETVNPAAAEEDIKPHT